MFRVASRPFGISRKKQRTDAADGPEAPVCAPCARVERAPPFSMDAPGMDALTEEQRAALVPLSQGRHVVITGEAGTGKSRIAAALKGGLAAAGTRYACTATTGVAGTQVEGVTLDSYLGITPGCTVTAAVTKLCYQGRLEEVAACDVLIVDEVSMLSPDKLRLALNVLRAVRLEAGLPLIAAFGDFLQLRPVEGGSLLDVVPSNPAVTWLDDLLGGPAVTTLATVHRQAGQDQEGFRSLLSRARVGALTPEDVAALRARVVPEGDRAAVVARTTMLFAKRDQVARHNADMLKRLGTPVSVVVGKVSLRKRAVRSSGSKGRYGPPASSPPCHGDAVLHTEPVAGWSIHVPADMAPDFKVTNALVAEARGMVADARMPARLEVAVGARVMWTANVDAPTLVNGTCGTVVEVRPCGTVVVKADSGPRVTVSPLEHVRKWSKTLDLVYSQLPLQAAAALTIHKSQSLTLESACLDIGTSVFEAGQAYVALSRVARFENLHLLHFEKTVVRADPVAVAWHAAHSASATKT